MAMFITICVGGWIAYHIFTTEPGHWPGKQFDELQMLMYPPIVVENYADFNMGDVIITHVDKAVGLVISPETRDRFLTWRLQDDKHPVHLMTKYYAIVTDVY